MGRFLAFRDAIAFARRAHDGQKRADGRVYVSHPLAVLQLLLSASADLPHDAYVSALLHDCVEDGQSTVDKVFSSFGEDIAAAVSALTRSPRPTGAKEEEHEMTYISQLAAANEQLPYVLLVKMADRIHNLETAYYLPSARRKKLLDQTVSLYLPFFAREEARQTHYAEAYRFLLTLLEESVGRLRRQAK